MTAETLEKQIYALVMKLRRGNPDVQNFPLLQKVNNLKKKLDALKKQKSWNDYLSK